MQFFYRLPRHMKPRQSSHYRTIQEITLHHHGSRCGVTVGVAMDDAITPSIPIIHKSVAFQQTADGFFAIENLYYERISKNGNKGYVPYKTRRHRQERRAQSFIVPPAITLLHDISDCTYSHPFDALTTSISTKIPSDFNDRIINIAGDVSASYYQAAPSSQWLVEESHSPQAIGFQLNSYVSKLSSVATKRDVDALALSLIPAQQPHDPVVARCLVNGPIGLSYFMDHVQSPQIDTTIPPPMIPRSDKIVITNDADYGVMSQWLNDGVPPDFEVGYICNLGYSVIRKYVGYVYNRLSPFIGEHDFDRVENLFLIDNVAEAAARWINVYSTTNDPSIGLKPRDSFTIYVRRNFNEEACVDFLRADGTPVVSIYIDLAVHSLASVGIAPLDYNV